MFHTSGKEQAFSAREEMLKVQPQEAAVGKVFLITQVWLNVISKEHSFTIIFLLHLLISNQEIIMINEADSNY